MQIQNDIVLYFVACILLKSAENVFFPLLSIPSFLTAVKVFIGNCLSAICSYTKMPSCSYEAVQTFFLLTDQDFQKSQISPFPFPFPSTQQVSEKP